MFIIGINGFNMEEKEEEDMKVAEKLTISHYCGAVNISAPLLCAKYHDSFLG